jgi:protein PhnA
MNTLPPCPECHADYTYEDRALYVCPSCGHEWSPAIKNTPLTAGPKVFKDAFGNLLQDGDSVTLIKDLKINGSSEVIKVGTKVKGIRLIESDNGHDIDCKISGFGAMQLKSEFVKKSK